MICGCTQRFSLPLTDSVIHSRKKSKRKRRNPQRDNQRHSIRCVLSLGETEGRELGSGQHCMAAPQRERTASAWLQVWPMGWNGIELLLCFNCSGTVSEGMARAGSGDAEPWECCGHCGESGSHSTPILWRCGGADCAGGGCMVRPSASMDGGI